MPLLADYAISSYTPSLSALLDPPDIAPSSNFQLLTVIEPSAPGASYIPNTEKELENIRHHFEDQDIVVFAASEATKKEVMKEMKNCHWLHLACHGIQNPIDPTKSALLLRDGHLTLEDITRLDLPHAEFAFLSACQTTTGDEKLSEEAVHIAGGMLLAGYRSVVATMWSIRDELAPEVAEEFYAHIRKDSGRPDVKKAAEALHISVNKLREKHKLPL
ncbi:16737_t:CDS:2, partial [Acaulospora colombiana]